MTVRRGVLVGSVLALAAGVVWGLAYRSAIWGQETAW